MSYLIILSLLESKNRHVFFFFQAEDGIRDFHVTGVQTCALPISGWQSGSAGGEQGGQRAAGGGVCRPVVTRSRRAVSGLGAARSRLRRPPRRIVGGAAARVAH